MKNEDIIKKWLVGKLSDSEKKEFETTEDFKQINKLFTAVKSFKAPEYNEEQEYNKFFKHTRDSKREIKLKDRFSLMLKVAAVVIFTLTAGYFSYTYFTPVNHPEEWYADQREMYLPDSSFVSLNKGSEIKFSRDGWKNKRNVELKGEAFFKVKKGSIFKVKTEHGLVTVLGTEFNVKDRESYFEVTCFSGKVKVRTAQNTVLLKQNDAFRIIDDIEKQYQISSGMEPDWLTGESSFRSVPLNLVIDEFERQYNVSVVAKDVNLTQLFTGSFPHNNVEIALESITIPLNLIFAVEGNQIEFLVEKDK